MKKFPNERRGYAAVAGKQQFSIARTKLPPLVIAGSNGLISMRLIFSFSKLSNRKQQWLKCDLQQEIRTYFSFIKK